MVSCVLDVDIGSPRRPAEQSVEGNDDDRCNRNQHPPVHADPSTNVAFRLILSCAKHPPIPRRKQLAKPVLLANCNFSGSREQPHCPASSHILINNLLAQEPSLSYYQCTSSSRHYSR